MKNNALMSLLMVNLLLFLLPIATRASMPIKPPSEKVVITVLPIPTLEKIVTSEVVEIPPPNPSPEVLGEKRFALPKIPRITCEELKSLMDKEIDFGLVDTRLELSFKRGHLKGAINIPDTPRPPLTEKIIEMKLLSLPRDKLVVLYCD